MYLGIYHLYVYVFKTLGLSSTRIVLLMFTHERDREKERDTRVSHWQGCAWGPLGHGRQDPFVDRATVTPKYHWQLDRDRRDVCSPEHET